MATKREAILLVPGIRSAQQGEHLDVLVEGIRGAAESFRCEPPGPAVIEGMRGKRLVCSSLDHDETKEVDVFECFLSDLVPLLTNESALVKLRDGTSLLGFWFFSGVWKGLRRKTYLVVTALMSSAVLLLWYVSVLALGFKAIGALQVDEKSWMADVVSFAANVGDQLGNWMVWLGISTLIGFLRGDRLANIGHFLRLYLQSGEVRIAFRLRVREPLQNLIASKQYERVTLLAHSFGAVLATDVMADIKTKDAQRVRVVTLGAPIAVLRHVGTWVAGELHRCEQNKTISSWLDYHSRADWMGARMPFAKPSFPFKSEELGDMGGWSARFSGATHRAYFSKREVMDALLASDAGGSHPGGGSAAAQP